MQRQQPALSKMKGMKKNDNNILSLRIKQIEFPNPRHRNAKQEQSICERASELRRERGFIVCDSRGQYFSWPGHGDVTKCHDKQYKCHTLRWTNPVPILSGSLHSLIAEKTEHWDFLKCTSPSPGVSGFVNAQCLFTGNDRSNAKTSIQYQLVPCPKSRVPTWDASCLTPRLSQWPILGQMFVCRVCVPGCPSTWYNRTPESRALIHTNRVIQMANLISDSQPRSDPRRWYGFSRRICSAECREERIYLSVVNESSHS